MLYPFVKMGGTASTSDAVARRPLDAEKIMFILFFLLISSLYSGNVKAFELYKTFQTPDVFLAEMFNNQVPAPTVLNLDAKAQSEISAVFNRPFPSQRVRYWKDANKTVWVFDDIGKEGYVPTTSGFAVSNGAIETARVLIYRESRGEQVAEPSFLTTEMKVTKPTALIFKDIPTKFQAARYHSWIASNENFPADLEITAEDEEGGVMAIRHSHFSISAVQFHPESILTDVGEQIVRNFIEANKK